MRKFIYPFKTSINELASFDFPQMDRQFIVTTDGSYTAIGYSLSQIGPDGKEHPVAFGGRSLHANEKKLDVYRN